MHAAQEVLKALLTVEVIKPRVHLNPQKLLRMVLISLFQPFECLALISNTGAAECYIE